MQLRLQLPWRGHIKDGKLVIMADGPEIRAVSTVIKAAGPEIRAVSTVIKADNTEIMGGSMMIKEAGMATISHLKSR